MTTILWISIGTTVGFVSSWLILRRRRLVADSAEGAMVSGARRKSGVQQQAKSYQGVTISPCLEACEAAAAQRGQRYLASEAPELPLSECDTAECACRYRYHDDRRENEDRRFEFSQVNSIGAQLDGGERRTDEKDDRRRSKSRAEPSAYFNNY